MIDFEALTRAMLQAGVPYGLPVATYGGGPSQGVHLGVFSEPYLSLVLAGEKTVESRFSRVRSAPFQEVSPDDVLLLKAVAGPVCGIAKISAVWFYDLAHVPLADVRRQFGERICGSDSFWESQADASYVSLLELTGVKALPPIQADKRDRRGWVSLSSRQLSMELI